MMVVTRLMSQVAHVTGVVTRAPLKICVPGRNSLLAWPWSSSRPAVSADMEKKKIWLPAARAASMPLEKSTVSSENSEKENEDNI